jgi:GH24 family phage-related lysozyme (muramidase)
MSAIDVTYARLMSEEGRKVFAYNDATGQRVTCQPAGNLTIAVGVNLEVGLDDDEIDWLSKHRLSKLENRLNAYDWYRNLDMARQSVLLDIAFNAGVSGLLHYPRMLSAIQQQEWKVAAVECHSADARLDGRYAGLAKILLTGALA